MRLTGEEPVKECPLNSADTVHFTQDQNSEPAALSGDQISFIYEKEIILTGNVDNN